MQPEIEAYYHDVAEKYHIPPRIRFQTSVESADWDSKLKTWSVNVWDQRTQQKYTLRSRILVSAVGALSTPKTCDIPGHEKFQGKLFHSATWDHNFDYTNKEIIALGISSSLPYSIPSIVSENTRYIAS